MDTPPSVLQWRSLRGAQDGVHIAGPLQVPLGDRVLTPGGFIYLLVRAQAGMLRSTSSTRVDCTIMALSGGGARNINTVFSPILWQILLWFHIELSQYVSNIPSHYLD